MEKPFRTSTQRRQTTFFVSATAFLSIYIFDVQITSLEIIGLKIQLGPEFVRVVLFWMSIFLFCRLVLDVSSGLVYFSWNSDRRTEIKNLKTLRGYNLRAIDLLTTPASKFTIEKLLQAPYDSNTDLHRLMGDLSQLLKSQNLLENRTTLKINSEETTDADQYARAIWLVEDARPHMLSICTSASKWQLWQLARLRIGIIPFILHLLFDFVVPAYLCYLILSVAYGDADWMKYKNLSWLQIEIPNTLPTNIEVPKL